MTYVASHAGIFELIFTDLLLGESLRILVFNLALEALEALVTVKMLPFSPQVQRIVRPHRRFHRILLLAHNASTTVAGNTAQPSPEFLAAVVQAVKALLPGEQASVSHPDPSGNSSVLDQATNSSSSAMLGGIPDQDLSSQASALWTARLDFPHILPWPRYLLLKAGLPLLYRHLFAESIARVVLRYHRLASCVSGWPCYK